MKCANCGAEMMGEKCTHCGWKVSTPPENRDPLIHVLDYLAGQFMQYEKDMHHNEEDYAHGPLRTDLDKKQEEIRKAASGHKDRFGTIVNLLAFIYCGYAVLNCILGGVTIPGLLVRMVVALAVSKSVLHLHRWAAKKKISQKAGSAVQDAKKALESSYNNRKNSIQQSLHQAIDPYNFLTPDVQNAEACRAMSTYLKDSRATNYPEAYRLYHQLVIAPAQQKAEMQKAINRTYEEGEKVGYEEGYSEGYDKGYEDGNYLGQSEYGERHRKHYL